MTNSITQSNLIEQLRNLFPEVEELYQDRLRAWKGDGAPTNYEVVGFVLRPYLKQEMAKEKVTDFLLRFASFCEKVCISGDVEAVNVIWIKIFEWLIFRPKELRFLWPVLGPVTKAQITDAAHRWSEAARSHGRTEELPENNLPS